MHLQRFSFYPFAVLVIQSLLCDFANVYFGIEVCCKCFVVVACVAIHNVEVVNFVEMVFCCVGSEYLRYTRVEPAAKDCSESCLLELLFVSPLPAVFKVRFVLWLVVSSIQIVATACQTSLHNGEVLVWQRKVYHQFWLERIEKCL